MSVFTELYSYCIQACVQWTGPQEPWLSLAAKIRILDTGTPSRTIIQLLDRIVDIYN